MAKPYRVRMLTLHLDCQRVEDPLGELEEASYRLSEASDIIAGEYGYEVWTRRIVLDNCSVDEASEVIESHTPGEELVSLGNYRADSVTTGFLERLTEEGYYAALQLGEGWRDARHASKLIHELSEKEPSRATHIGINTLGEPIETPYFPLAGTKTHRGLTLGLLYPNHLLEAYRKGGFDGLVTALNSAAREAHEMLQRASEIVKATPAGVDLSPSPWMAESTLGLVEYIAGVRLPEPGIAYGISLVNKAIQQVNDVPLTGFNEVQLPIAEDLKMKARVSELNTSARDIARLSGVCLAGLDLAVVPADIDRVAGLLLEVKGYSVSKGKPLGVRIIPVDEVEPGDKVFLEKFGETPVIPI